MTKHLKMEKEIKEGDTLENKGDAAKKQEGENLEGESLKKSKEFQSAVAQKEHWREKAEKAEKDLEELRKKLPKEEGVKLSTKGLNPMDIVKLNQALKDFSEDEVGFISRNSESDSIEDVIKSSKDEWVITAIEAKRDKDNKDKMKPKPTTLSGDEASEGTTKSFEDLKDEKGNISEEKQIEWIKEQSAKKAEESEEGKAGV